MILGIGGLIGGFVRVYLFRIGLLLPEDKELSCYLFLNGDEKFLS
jgi:hypothetical protein